MLKIEVKTFIGFLPTALYKEHTHTHPGTPFVDGFYLYCDVCNHCYYHV